MRAARFRDMKKVVLAWSSWQAFVDKRQCADPKAIIASVHYKKRLLIQAWRELLRSLTVSLLIASTPVHGCVLQWQRWCLVICITAVHGLATAVSKHVLKCMAAYTSSSADRILCMPHDQRKQLFGDNVCSRQSLSFGKYPVIAVSQKMTLLSSLSLNQPVSDALHCISVVVVLLLHEAVSCEPSK